jgi:hypothetical protein
MNPFPGSFLPSRITVTESLVVVRFDVDADGATIFIPDIFIPDIDWAAFGTNGVP